MQGSEEGGDRVRCRRYRATLAVKGRPAGVDLVLSGGLSAHWRVALPATWPPPDGAALLARAGTVWRSLRSVSFSETLGSGAGHIAVSTWRVQAPDRIAYQVKAGYAGIARRHALG